MKRTRITWTVMRSDWQADWWLRLFVCLCRALCSARVVRALAVSVHQRTDHAHVDQVYVDQVRVELSWAVQSCVVHASDRLCCG